jgi:hypothetical protein
MGAAHIFRSYMMYQPSLKSAPRTRVLLATRPQTWHSRAVEAYRQSERDGNAALRADLAARVSALTERAVAPGSVYVDSADRTATVNLDGVTFRLRRHELVLLRPCPECGLGHYESPAIATVADLGYALSAWRPACQNCLPEDPVNWLEREDI